MSGYKISEAARATGFTVSALRFYEQAGVVTPERTETGYRSYRDDHVEALRFVARGKQLGLSLDEITELLDLLEDDECEPVQSRIHKLLSERISQAQDRIAELVGLTAQLQRTEAKLGLHTPEGECDERCGCRSEPDVSVVADDRDLIPLAGANLVLSGASTCACFGESAASMARTQSAQRALDEVRQGRGRSKRRRWPLKHPRTSGGEHLGDIGCSLDPDLVGERVGDWNLLLDGSTGRVPIPGGIRILFEPDVDVADLVSLAQAEQSCCAFFAFNIGIGPEGVTLDVTGPDDAQEVIASVFGVAA